MAGKKKSARAPAPEAQQVIRQFAWNLAGSLAGQGAPARREPAKK